jgi:hypothetical protein
MLSLIYKVQENWKEYGFEIILALCITFIIIYGLYRKITGKKGTWSSTSYYIPFYNTKNYAKQNSQNITQLQPKTQPRDSKGETECRRVLQQLFSKYNSQFNKARPDFLRNPVTGGNFNLELDCFEPQLRLAVEYNGVQHYKYVPHFHNNKEAFLNQKYRDEMKRQLCKEHGINLIEVPYTVKVGDIRNFLEKEVILLGYQIY